MTMDMDMDLSGPGEGSAYRYSGEDEQRNSSRSRSHSSPDHHNHPATHGYNDYSAEQVQAQEQQQQESRRRQTRHLSMQHTRRHDQEEAGSTASGGNNVSGSGGGGQTERRGSMSALEQKQRRQAIKDIMADKSIPDVERRKSIQALMDGRRRSSVGTQGSFGSHSHNHSAYSPAGSLGHLSAPHGSHGGGGGGGDDGSVHSNRSGHSSVHSTHSAHAVLSRMKAHPYSATTTRVPGVAAQDPYEHAQITEHSKRAELSRPACEHYNRNCTIVAPCCGAAFGCRICHDDCPVLPPPISQQEEMMRQQQEQELNRKAYPRSSSMPTSFASFGEPQHHVIDRFAIQEIICRRCYTRQSSKANKCIACHTQFGEYHCAICNLWMDASERPYHCADCGFCRVGGAENFRHCQDCGMCIDASLFAQHNCKVGKYMQNCPVCQEDLFSSRSASHEMPCGHAIHWHCFRELAAHDSRCPVCKKTAETHERMQPTWNAMAMGIELQPVPPDLAKAVTIICNDCEKTDHDRSWHFLGVQCRACTSFNTVVERITMVGADAHAFLARVDPHPSQRAQQQQQQQQGQQHAQEQQQQQQPNQVPQATATVRDGAVVPSEEQERLFRQQQEYQARYLQQRRAEQGQMDGMDVDEPGGQNRLSLSDRIRRRRSMGP